MTSTSLRTRAIVLLAASFLLIAAAGCGSSDKKTTAGGTTAPAGDSGGGGGGGGAKGDPCQWYTAAEMEKLLGFPVKMEKQTAGPNEKCVYDAPKNYSSVEITPSDEVTYNNNKSFAKSPDGVKLAGEFKAVDGIGDEAYGSGNKGGATLDALKGKASVGILITNGGGGKTAGNIDTDAKAFDLAKQIADKVLG